MHATRKELLCEFVRFLGQILFILCLRLCNEKVNCVEKTRRGEEKGQRVSLSFSQRSSKENALQTKAKMQKMNAWRNVKLETKILRSEKRKKKIFHNIIFQHSDKFAEEEKSTKKSDHFWPWTAQPPRTFLAFSHTRTVQKKVVETSKLLLQCWKKAKKDEKTRSLFGGRFLSENDA